jgi:hypothetical protein
MELFISQLLIPFLGAILVGIAGAVAKKINKKLDIEIEDDAIQKAVYFAEEYGRKYLQTHNQKLPSSAKMSKAIEFLLATIPADKKEAYKDRLKAKVEAKVAELLHIKEE